MGQEDPLEEGTATHSSILAWRISWPQKPGRLQPVGLQKVRHNQNDLRACAHTRAHMHTHSLTRRPPGSHHLPVGARSRLSHREVEVQGWNPALWCPSLSPPPSPVATVSALALSCDQLLPTALSPHQARGCPLSPVCLLNSDPAAWAQRSYRHHRSTGRPGEHFHPKGKENP